MIDLGELTTEQRNAKTMDLDDMTPMEIVSVMNEEDLRVVDAVKKALPDVVTAIDYATKSLRLNARIIYIGAGTSGRLGVLDAVECPPTFGIEYDKVIGLIAGGDKAFVKAVEGAEDSEELGKQDLADIDLTENDTVIGLAASGRTPYVIGALQYAREIGCKTVGIYCNAKSQMDKWCDCKIKLVTGAEILTGSTRLKAGTAEKMVLNMISTVSMIGIGKSYKNLMIDLMSTNEKLKVRTENIVMEAVGCNKEDAKKALVESDGEAKVAITKMLIGCDATTARQYLNDSEGKVNLALRKYM